MPTHFVNVDAKFDDAPEPGLLRAKINIEITMQPDLIDAVLTLIEVDSNGDGKRLDNLFRWLLAHMGEERPTAEFIMRETANRVKELNK